MYKKVLLKYNKEILHMRSRLEAKQFGLVFGAGTSVGLGFPSWNKLLDEIAKSCTSLDSSKIRSQPSLAQCLFQAFSSNYKKEFKVGLHPDQSQSAGIQSGWTRVVIDKLYKDVPSDVRTFKAKSKYLKKLLPIIKKTRMTVNYNFDDSIQRLLNEFRTSEEKMKDRPYRTDWRVDPQMYSHHAVIYHPNGYLPKYTGEKPSDSIVLLDDAFGDQLIESMAGKYTHLVNHYAQNTCLLIGLSLDDPTLQNILRRNALTHPGHVHYYVKYISKDKQLNKAEERTISNANFETYNLVTLFLNDNEIGSLADLINMADSDFHDLCDECGAKRRFVYYLTGCVAAGKTTSVSFFRSLSVHDEWNENMPEGMNKDPSMTSEENIKKIDVFVARQWRKKNRQLLESKGVVVVDRCQLDAFGFTEWGKWKEKASFLHKNISPNKSQDKLQNGMIIFLKNSAKELSTRAILGLRETREELLDKQQYLLLKCYKEGHGILHIDGGNMSRHKIAKLIARIIHMEKYEEFDLQTYLEDIKNGKMPHE